MSSRSDRHHVYAVLGYLGSIYILLCSLSGTVDSGKVFNYCQAGLCTSGTRHVACNGHRFGSNCTRPMLIKMSPKYVNLILNYHNAKRNHLACGSMRRYGSASSMQKLHWNDELALLAEYNAKSCDFAHDECHNTIKYRYTGQSIGMKWFHGLNYTTTRVVRDILRNWYLEHKLAKQRDLDRFMFGPHAFEIGHFTQMVHADTTELGCALVRFLKRTKNISFVHFYLVCNYSEGNLVDRPVYRQGKRCSRCKHGCTGAKFRCLCRG
ncbi:antigen 5 like allergen Cul n 1-like [Malaya genurostris]|uniref:antigen 5 like allergen Cul n 1-like n=1 Tax=Malaya genurostris TaxID=325434 RepID=UPI0026F3AA13|nr:antigen 5 like allergen Cul n 1-like [Malaya genurostris]